MYYVIEERYVGPDDDKHKQGTIEIQTEPARTNSSHEVRTEGWCGTYNDVATYAHGEYATIDDARAAIAEIFGPVRSVSPYGEAFKEEEYFRYDPTVVEVFKPGEYEELSQAEVEELYRDYMSSEDTDEEIVRDAARIEEECRSQGFTTGYTVDELADLMRARRQELLDEREDEDERE